MKKSIEDRLFIMLAGCFSAIGQLWDVVLIAQLLDGRPVSILLAMADLVVFGGLLFIVFRLYCKHRTELGCFSVFICAYSFLVFAINLMVVMLLLSRM